MSFRLGTTARNAACDGITALLNSGTIMVRTGTQPTNVSDAPTGTLLGTCTYGSTAYGASSSGTGTANSISSDTSADASGTAGYFVNRTSGSANHSDGTCGQGTGDLSFDNSVIVSGGVIAISSFTITVPIQ